MGSLSDAVALMNIKAEADSMKRREIALIYAMQEMEKERIKMHAALYDANRCADCVRRRECEKKKGETTYKVKMRAPESFCSMWEYGGEYTPVSELIAAARKTRGGRE